MRCGTFHISWERKCFRSSAKLRCPLDCGIVSGGERYAANQCAVGGLVQQLMVRNNANADQVFGVSSREAPTSEIVLLVVQQSVSGFSHPASHISSRHVQYTHQVVICRCRLTRAFACREICSFCSYSPSFTQVCENRREVHSRQVDI